MKASAKGILEAVAKIGIIGAITAVVWAAVVVRGTMVCAAGGFDSLKRRVAWFIKPEKRGIEGNAYSVVESVRKVNRIKVLRVRDCGVDTKEWAGRLGIRKASVSFMYAGHVDYFVDLSKMSVRLLENGDYEITLPEPEMSDVLSDDGSHSYEITTAGTSAIPCDEFRESHGMFSSGRQDEMLNAIPKLQAEAIRRTAESPENVAAAKARAEECVRFMLSPLTYDGKSKIVFAQAQP